MKHPIPGLTCSAGAFRDDVDQVLQKTGHSGRPLRRFLEPLLEGGVLTFAVIGGLLSGQAINRAAVFLLGMGLAHDVGWALHNEAAPLEVLPLRMVYPEGESPRALLQLRLTRPLEALSVAELKRVLDRISTICHDLGCLERDLAANLNTPYVAHGTPGVLEMGLVDAERVFARAELESLYEKIMEVV